MLVFQSVVTSTVKCVETMTQTMVCLTAGILHALYSRYFKTDTMTVTQTKTQVQTQTMFETMTKTMVSYVLFDSIINR